jgi:hypothetical protein
MALSIGGVFWVKSDLTGKRREERKRYLEEQGKIIFTPLYLAI